jgi:broad specificity phosphatase PhoE
MLPRSFYFVRHGETDWNKEGRIQGHTDIPLNATGRQQAEHAAPVFLRRPIDIIVTSNLSRAYETASIINAALQKPPVSSPMRS